jgi:hypothetical protein
VPEKQKGKFYNGVAGTKDQIPSKDRQIEPDVL